jgi:hypothetical protein
LGLSALCGCLDAQKLLLSTDTRGSKKRYYIRRTFDAGQQKVLHLSAKALGAISTLESGQSGQSGQNAETHDDDEPLPF